MQNEQYPMPAMTEQERQELIHFINSELSSWDCDGKFHRAFKVALAALTAEPVNLPDIVSEEFHDYGGYFEYSIYWKSLKAAIRAAGYEVKE